MTTFSQCEVGLYQAGELYDIPIDRYPNGEPLIKQTPEPFLENAPKLLLRPKSMEAFFAAMFWVDAIVERGYTVPHLVFPFALGARQDRINPTGDILFTAKSIAKEINARNFPSVTVIDCHSEVMPALIDRCRNIPLAKLDGLYGALARTEMCYDGVISPDAGAEKRASAVAKLLNVPLYHAWKTRDVTTGELNGFGIENISSRKRNIPNFLIVDDICDGGGTFVGLADHIKHYSINCNLDLLVTHGLFSKGVAALFERFDTIFTTDSIFRYFAQNNLVKIPICESLLREII